MIDTVMKKGKRIIITVGSQKRALEQLNIHDIFIIEKTRLLARESIYWISMNACIENTIEISQHVLVSSRCSQKTK